MQKKQVSSKKKKKPLAVGATPRISRTSCAMCTSSRASDESEVSYYVVSATSRASAGPKPRSPSPPPPPPPATAAGSGEFGLEGTERVLADQVQWLHDSRERFSKPPRRSLLACCLIAPHRGNNTRGTVAHPTCVCCQCVSCSGLSQAVMGSFSFRFHALAVVLTYPGPLGRSQRLKQRPALLLFTTTTCCFSVFPESFLKPTSRLSIVPAAVPIQSLMVPRSLS
jgi:hypothetical protein